MAGELIEFPHDVAGIAMNLEEDQVGSVLLGDYTEIKEGDEVRRTGRIMSVPVGDALIGRWWTRWAGPSTARAPSIPPNSTPSSGWRGRGGAAAGEGADADRHQGPSTP